MSATPSSVLDAYGAWLADLAPWSHFITLTHRLPDGRVALHDRVGVQRHRRLVKLWLHTEVLPRDPGAVWWSETELTKIGTPHEHGVLALADPRAPVLSMRQAWWEMAGYARVEEIEESSLAVARYVIKYSVKATAWPSTVHGIAGEDPLATRVITHPVSASPRREIFEHERRFFYDPARVIDSL